MGDEQFRRPIGIWATKKRTAAQNAHGRQKFLRPKMVYGLRNVKASPKTRRPRTDFCGSTAFIVRRPENFAAQSLGFDIRTSSLRRHHFRRPQVRTSKRPPWATILSVAQNHFPCSDSFDFDTTFFSKLHNVLSNASVDHSQVCYIFDNLC